MERGEIELLGLRFGGASGFPAVLSHVAEGSAAERAGLRAGQTVIHIAGRLPGENNPISAPVVTVADAHAALLRLSAAGAEAAIATADARPPKTFTVSDPPPRSRPVHPAQLYSAIDAFLLCLLLVAYYPFRRREGAVLALGLTIHPISRFVLEIIRTDEAPVLLGMSISQNLSVLILIVAAGLWWWVFTRGRRVSYR
jgi:phosphatidylglycerol:prolipoprotein diacylglycerol transferase